MATNLGVIARSEATKQSRDTIWLWRLGVIASSQPQREMSMEENYVFYLINLMIIYIQNDNIFLYLHFSEKGIYSAVNQRTTTEKEQRKSKEGPEGRASG
jgi:hypothetical protein